MVQYEVFILRVFLVIYETRDPRFKVLQAQEISCRSHDYFYNDVLGLFS
jgi:hypothetical protein